VCIWGDRGDRVYVHYGLVQTNLSPVSNLTHSKIAVSNTYSQYSPTHVISQVTPIVYRSILANRWSHSNEICDKETWRYFILYWALFFFVGIIQKTRIISILWFGSITRNRLGLQVICIYSHTSKHETISIFKHQQSFLKSPIFSETWI